MTDGTLDTTGAKPAVRLSRYLPLCCMLSNREWLKSMFVVPHSGCPAGSKAARSMPSVSVS